MFSSTPIDPRCFSINQYTTTVGYILPSVRVIGIIGNALMFLTLHKGRLNESPHVYLKCIALASFIHLLSALGDVIMDCAACQHSVETLFYLARYYWTGILFIRSLMHSWLTFLTLCMTAERCVYVRWPLETRSLCTRERAREVCITTFFVSCFFALCYSLSVKTDYVVSSFWEPATSRQFSRFACKLNSDRASPDSAYICFSEEFPLGLQSYEADARCSGQSVSPSHTVPLTNESLYTLDCLHRHCKLPRIPRNLTFKPRIPPGYGGKHRALETTFMNASLIIWTEKDKDGFFTDWAPRANPTGHAMLVNDTCVFELGYGFKGPSFPPSTLRYPPLAKYIGTIQCVTSVQDFENPFSKYARFWLFRILPICTCLMAVFNAVIIILVRRANRKAEEEVFGEAQRSDAARRRTCENRLTFSLLALSCIKILVEILKINWMYLVTLRRSEEYDGGSWFRALGAVTRVAFDAGVSSHFCLLAFINRRFREKFITEILCGTFKLHKVVDKLRR